MTDSGYIFELYNDLTAYSAAFLDCQTGHRFPSETAWSDGKRPICEAALYAIRNK
jgi:hypothetical protein